MFKIGTIYRIPSPHQESEPKVDGLDNFYYETNTPNVGFAFQKGIHNVHLITAPSGKTRCPLIIISSTPRKAGSDDTPWHDRYNPDYGYVKYYGDNKDISRQPESARGNRILLNLLKHYHSEDKNDRMENAVPIIFFEKCSYGGRPKGNAIFQGFGVLESAELVTQYDSKHSYFANYLFNFCIFSLAEDNEQFDWRWIKDRCNSSLEVNNTMTYAPTSWKRWIEDGHDNLHLIRRRVSHQGLIKSRDQMPEPDDMDLLKAIYDYYGGKKSSSNKHGFEYLAMEVTVKTIEESGAKCMPGWITKASGDGGVDYVLRIDIGQEQLSSVQIIVLGQAKCTDPLKPVNGNDIARTVARMKRGWIGAFVSTSYFSESVQKEVKEDSYPLMMINGAKVVDVVKNELSDNKQTLVKYLDSLKEKYEQMIRIPEDILDL